MRKKTLLQSWPLVLALIFANLPQVFSQVTTATISGIVTDELGAPLAGATVTIEYPDAGIRKTVTTKGDGRFTLNNQRVGGPYRITVSHVGQQENSVPNIFLELGQNNVVDVTLTNKAAVLQNVTVGTTGTQNF